VRRSVEIISRSSRSTCSCWGSRARRRGSRAAAPRYLRRLSRKVRLSCRRDAPTIRPTDPCAHPVPPESRSRQVETAWWSSRRIWGARPATALAAAAWVLVPRLQNGPERERGDLAAEGKPDLHRVRQHGDRSSTHRTARGSSPRTRSDSRPIQRSTAICWLSDRRRGPGPFTSPTMGKERSGRGEQAIPEEICRDPSSTRPRTRAPVRAFSDRALGCATGDRELARSGRGCGWRSTRGTLDGAGFRSPCHRKSEVSRVRLLSLLP